MRMDFEQNTKRLQTENKQIMNRNGTEQTVPFIGQETGSFGTYCTIHTTYIIPAFTP